MGFEEYHLETLIQLGLTPNQGKLYLNLLRTGKSSGRTLSRETNFARQEVYRILEELHERGLVERIISTPTEFKAVAIQEVISILLLEKNRKLEQTKERIQSIIEGYSSLEGATTPHKEFRFSMIPPKRLVNETRERMLENAKKSIQLITTNKRFIQGISHFFEIYERSLQRNVKTQIIVNTGEDTNSIRSNKLELLERYPNFKLKTIPQTKANILIIDKTEAIITLCPKADLGASPVLWTNHPEFLEVLQDYFQSLWKKHIPQPITD